MPPRKRKVAKKKRKKQEKPKQVTLQVGDVIVSREFARGQLSADGKYIMINGTRKTRTVTMSEEDRVREAARTGKVPPKKRTVELTRTDRGRGEAQFVVEEIRDVPGWGTSRYIIARRLTETGKYDPQGELIRFTENFFRLSKKRRVRIVKKMVRQVTFK